MRLLAAGLALALAGCATAPVPTDLLSGKLAVQVASSASTPARGVTAAFELQGTAERGGLELTSPLGTVMARAHWSPGEVVLTTAEGDKHFADLTALADEVLGEPLPLAALFDWLHGRPWSGAASRNLAAPGAGFEQLGWTIALDQWAEGTVIARRAAPPAVTVRAKLSR